VELTPALLCAVMVADIAKKQLAFCTRIGTFMIERLDRIPLLFWKTLSGDEPVRDWLNSLPKEDQRTIGRDIAKVQYGWPIGMPVCRPLGDGLWEVRSSLPSKREARVLFGFYNDILIAVAGFIKKTQATPKAELKIARERFRSLKNEQR